MLTPSKVEALVDLIEQAIFEFDKLAIGAEDGPKYELYDLAPEFRAMSRTLGALHHQIVGKIAFVESRGLTFMRRAQQTRHIIPSFNLMNAIDEACRKGVSR